MELLASPLGANVARLPWYQFATGGCRDGTGVSHIFSIKAPRVGSVS
jgi:hypothetical protein